MAAFILRRLAQAVLVMLTVGLIAFALFRFVGDPVTFMLGQDATPEQRIEITRALGLDQPFYVQYLRFLGNAVQGEFGLSLRQVQPVSRLIVDRLPATLELSIGGALRSSSESRWAYIPRSGATPGSRTSCSRSRLPAYRCQPS